MVTFDLAISFRHKKKNITELLKKKWQQLMTEITWVPAPPQEIKLIKKLRKKIISFLRKPLFLLPPPGTHPFTQIPADLSCSQTPDRGIVPVSLQTPLKYRVFPDMRITAHHRSQIGNKDKFRQSNALKDAFVVACPHP